MSFYTQYLQAKAQRAKIVFVIKVGDFLEAFGDDADTIASVCGVVLHTVRIKDHGKHRMAGFPVSLSRWHIDKLNDAGYTVAVVEYVGE